MGFMKCEVLLFLLVFAVLGVLMPYMPAWYAGMDLPTSQVGYIVTLFFLVRTLTSPVVVWYSTRMFPMGKVFVILGSASVVTGLLLVLNAHNIILMLAISVLFSISTSALMPLAEYYGYQYCSDSGCKYGTMRAMGTISFASLSLLSGFLIGIKDSSIIIYTILCVLIMVVFTAIFTTKSTHNYLCKLDSDVNLLHVIRAWLTKNEMLHFVMIVMLQGANAVYYSFSVIHWDYIGYSGLLIGILWGMGAVAESIFFMISGVVQKRLNYLSIMMLGGIGSIIRWTALSTDPSLFMVFSSQVLHICSFAMVHLGTMLYVGQKFRDVGSAMTISVLFATCNLMITGLTFLVSMLYEAHRGQVYLISSVSASIGVIICIMLIYNNRKNVLGEN